MTRVVWFKGGTARGPRERPCVRAFDTSSRGPSRRPTNGTSFDERRRATHCSVERASTRKKYEILYEILGHERSIIPKTSYTSSPASAFAPYPRRDSLGIRPFVKRRITARQGQRRRIRGFGDVCVCVCPYQRVVIRRWWMLLFFLPSLIQSKYVASADVDSRDVFPTARAESDSVRRLGGG